MGFGKYNALDWGGGFGGEGRARGSRNGCEQAEKCQAREDSIHMDAVKLVPHSSGPYSSSVPSLGEQLQHKLEARQPGETVVKYWSWRGSLLSFG